MKRFLVKTLSIVTALSLPAVYTGYDTAVTAENVGENRFSVSFPEFSYITGHNDGRPNPVAKGTEYHSGVNLYADMPSSYDMREHGTISSVRNQGQYGTCWTHSSASSAETSVISAEPSVNLSELHTAYYSYYGDDAINITAGTLKEHLDWGGSAEIVTNMWAQWIGPVYESRLPYNNTDFFKDSGNSDNIDDMRYTSDYHLENAYLFDFNEDRSNFDDINNLIKQFVYEGHAVDVSFYHESLESYNSVWNCVNSNRLPKFANHAVTIAGWDDDFPAENFTIEPEHNGAWLVKNSWGYTFGDDGYMWISYEDRSLNLFGVYELGDKDNYTINYQHDTFVPTQLISALPEGQETGSSYMANIFTAESDMQIEAVSTYFQNAGTDYEITIYSGLSDDTDPTSAEPSAVTTGNDILTGYHTIELSESVPVKAGEKFGVVVKISSEDNKYVIPIESGLYIKDSKSGEVTDLLRYSSAEQIGKYTGKNESFCSPDGKEWTDIYGEDKKFSGEEKAEILDSLKKEIYSGISEDNESEMQKADEIYNTYEKLFSSGDLYATFGNISLKAFGNPEGNVRFSHISGEVPESETITLSGAGEIFVSVNGSSYVPYTEPLKITEETKISAYTNPLNVSERTYRPAIAGFNTLRYKGNLSGTGEAVKVSDSEYIIELSPNDNAFQLFPETSSEMIMDGKEIKPYEYTAMKEVPYGETDITIELNEPDKLSNTVKIRVIKAPVAFSLDNESIIFQSVFTVTAEDGIQFKVGGSVSDYAGQNITAVNNETGEEFIYTVPERAVLPELEYDYYYETLGFIPNETADLLTYLLKDDKFERDYISAGKRLVDGRWINSGMVMNKAFKVIPGETITFKVSAGNGKFASEPVTYKIPEAPVLTAENPEFDFRDGKYYLNGYDYEIAPSGNRLSEDDIDKMCVEMGYITREGFKAVMRKRHGEEAGDIEEILGLEWGTDYGIKGGEQVAVRLASTENQFASACRIITVGERKGDVNNDNLIDAVDATLVLMHYASMSTDGTGTIESGSLSRADYNGDGLIDAVDATAILMYYAEMSTIQNE
ncbi:MAG: hypothetical protein K2G36_08685 [Ruminococcus sp.]|nr:hypothetical protein [Ruminococcus sp.]